MESLVILVLLCAVALLLALSRKSDSERAQAHAAWVKSLETIFPYFKRNNVLSYSEEAFNDELHKQLPEGFKVSPKIRIADFVDSKTKDYQSMRKIWGRHVDFLIRDSSSHPIVAIELNGKSHLMPHRIDRDKEVKEILEGVGIPLETVMVGEVFSKSVEVIVKKYLV